MHCWQPACVSACPVGALKKTDEGPVVYNEDRCIGCRYCMVACPFDVPTFTWDRGLLEGAVIRKCSFCVDRLGSGLEPACAKTCPPGALTFGERDELIAEAQARIADRARQVHTTTSTARRRRAARRSSTSLTSRSKTWACPRWATSPSRQRQRADHGKATPTVALGMLVGLWLASSWVVRRRNQMMSKKRLRHEWRPGRRSS